MTSATTTVAVAVAVARRATTPPAATAAGTVRTADRPATTPPPVSATGGGVLSNPWTAPRGRLGDWARAPSDVLPLPAHAARRPGRCRGPQPPPAGPRRLHPAGRAGGLHLAAAGLAGVPQGGGHRPRGDGRDGRPGGALPRAAAPRALRDDRPVDRVRPHPLPAAGPPRQRLPPRPHPRGDVHAPGEGPLRLLQGPAGLALPDPDQV